MTDDVRVLVAHHGLMRLSVRMALEGEAKICAEAESVEEAVLQAKRQQPDVCIVGLGHHRRGHRRDPGDPRRGPPDRGNRPLGEERRG